MNAIKRRMHLCEAKKRFKPKSKREVTKEQRFSFVYEKQLKEISRLRNEIMNLRQNKQKMHYNCQHVLRMFEGNVITNRDERRLLIELIRLVLKNNQNAMDVFYALSEDIKHRY